MYIKVTFLALIAFIVPGCEIFTTRQPETPGTGTLDYDQPTSEIIVVSNFQSALRQKNTDVFMLCLADTNAGYTASQQYQFEPSAEAGARFVNRFTAWSRQDERRAFVTMISRSGPDQVPLLTLNDGRFDVRTPDSAVYVATYLLEIPLSLPSVPTRVAGTLRWTIVPNRLGLWAISHWRDAPSRANDTVPDSWSTLKALLTN